MSYPNYGAPPPAQYDPGYNAYNYGQQYPQAQGYPAQAYPAQQSYGAQAYPAQQAYDPNAYAAWAAANPAAAAQYASAYSQYPGYGGYGYGAAAAAAPSPWSGYVAPNAFKNKKALLIGINYIGHARGQLRGCINDVRNLYAFLTQHYFYRPENMRVLVDDSPDPNCRPTRANIIAACKWLLQNNQAGDALFFHYSGHGGQVADTSGDEDDGFDETILPCDYNTAGQIIDDDLHTLLVKPLVDGARLTAVMDCCHSGTGMDLPYVYKAKGPKMPKDPRLKEQKKKIKELKKQGYKVKVEKDKGEKGGKVSKKMKKKAEAFQKTLISRGIVVGISGCADHQTSADTSFQGQAQGAMSNALINVLKQNNFQITYDALLYKMREYLASSGKGLTQIPQLSYGREPFNLNDYFTC
eukprot:TRINITY_DN4396_c0_g1_i1.p1 TRINITY_DN4396_c0_g1~~TRINITY_DN4396_c0_g1_i1.p1  ORF type:complete len:411 (-),score=93.89 TRINITY_DN4396_c0_g1_i1:139-1371(-)